MLNTGTHSLTYHIF